MGNRIVRASRAILFGVLVMSCGCDADMSSLRIPNDPIPLVHDHPSWIGEDRIAFQSIGAIRVECGGIQIDDSAAGVVVMTLDGECKLAVPQGQTPAASSRLGQGICLIGSLAGPMVSFTSSDEDTVLEDAAWLRRSDLALSDNGVWAAWRCCWEDHTVGVWVYRFDLGQSQFVGQGGFPTWKPGSEVLLYRGGEWRPCLIEYTASSGQRDTIRTFSEDYSSLEMCYSPDGEKIAYDRFGLTAGQSGLCIYDRVTGSEQLVNHRRATGLSWGPGGIVYTNGCGDCEDDGCGVLWIYDPESGSDRQLTTRLQAVLRERSI